jgi:hypothetical protein
MASVVGRISWDAVRKVSGGLFVSSSGFSGLDLAGVIGGLIGTGVGVLSLGLYIASNNRTNQREAAQDARQHELDIQQAFDRGWRMRGQVMPNPDSPPDEQ